MNGRRMAFSAKIWIVALSCLWGITMSTMLHSAPDTKVFVSQGEESKLLELYTSQGCSSCPPAERWFSNLKHDKRLWKTIFPIAFHVDYWDYIGWKDEFAQPEYGKRQRLYQYLGNIRQVATPGFVVGGVGWNGWFRGQRLAAVSDYHIPKGKLTLSLSGAEAKIEYLADEGVKPVTETKQRSHSYRLNLAILGFDLVSSIDAGENKGRDLRQDFVVESLESRYLDVNAREPELWQGRIKLPKKLLNSSQQKALVAWVSYGNNPVATQVVGGWL